jgi:hypothetical protein
MKILEDIGLQESNIRVEGKVLRIGFVHSSGDVLGYYAILFEDATKPVRVFSRNTKFAQMLSLTLPGDRLVISVLAYRSEFEAGGVGTVIEVQNEALTRVTS